MTVYFIRDSSTNRIKIGYTTRPVEDRVKELQTGNSTKLEVIRTESGSMELEKTYHSLFSDYSHDREWFDCDGLLKEFLDNSHVFYNLVSFGDKAKLENRVLELESDILELDKEIERIIKELAV